MALVTHPLWLLVVGHLCRFRATVGTKDLATVPTVMLPVGEGEAAGTSLASVNIRIVGPLPARLLSELDLKKRKE